MATPQLAVQSGKASGAAEFYARYEWCLNPILPVRELLARLGEELEHYGWLEAAWQQKESIINLYLLACAIACAIDDYAASARLNLTSIARRVPQRLAFAITLAERTVNGIAETKSLLANRRLVDARRAWDRPVQQICAALAGGRTVDRAQCAALRDGLRALEATVSRHSVAAARMRIPEAFRCQDLTHEDALSMAGLFAAAHPVTSPIAIVGLRTAGAYFAPLIAARLAALGYRVDSLTIRPKNGVAPHERRRLQSALRRDAHLLVVDDHQGTGHTLRLTLSLLTRLGADPRKITVLVPDHPARPRWTLDGTAMIELPAADRHKVALLKPRNIEAVLAEIYRERGWDVSGISETPETEARNSAFEMSCGNGFDVRLKRVYQVHLSRGGNRVVKAVFAKSAGWGWLGYHAYFAASRLEGHVPQLVGLREGILITEWIDGVSCSPGDTGLAPQIASYVAQRALNLRLSGDIWLCAESYRWTGWDDLAEALSGVYGRYWAHWKRLALRRRLRECASAMPALADGRMVPEEWIESHGRIYKGDFEQHNFGGGELDLADPAYDLASVIFEFGLGKEAEETLLAAYAKESGDTRIGGRILLYKLLCGLVALKRSASRIARRPEDLRRFAWNLRHLDARRFLVEQMNRYGAQRLGDAGQPLWSRRLFFLDLDGVLDWNFLGFPHTTPNGLRALAVLKRAGYAIIPNTGRGADEVRRYCETYGFPGGIAELGGVFMDLVRGVEMPLITPDAADQLRRVRAAALEMPGVFVDAGYRYSARVYRHTGGPTSGLTDGEAESLLSRCRCSDLRFQTIATDTTFVQKHIDKASALAAAKNYLGCNLEPVVAIGDSAQDCTMLRAADIAYAPGNGSAAVRALERTPPLRVMRPRLQNGLLAAALELSGARVGAELPEEHLPPTDLVWALLAHIDRKPVGRLLSCLDWRGI